MYVELKNINKTFGDYKASDNVNFGIEKGKLIGLLGPSGSGKTTILRMIAGLENPDSGEIVIDGKVVNDIPASKRGIGFVFQNYALFRYMTVFDNIAFGLKIQKKSKKFIKERVNELVKLIGLEGLEKRYPSQLSGPDFCSWFFHNCKHSKACKPHNTCVLQYLHHFYLIQWLFHVLTAYFPSF